MPPADQVDDIEQEQAPSAPRYGHVVKAITEHPWAILPTTLDKIVEIVRLRASGGRLSDEEIRLRLAGASAAPATRTAGKVLVIPVFGVMAHRMNMFSDISGGTSTEQLGAQLQEALNDSRVSAILFDIDSPGGSVHGIQELADAIFEARGRKPLYAYVNATCASAAYCLASQCDQISMTPSGQTGSIGVIAVHEDLSKQAAMLGVRVEYITAPSPAKAEGQPFLPLSADGRAALQRRVDEYYAAFRAGVERGRSGRLVATAFDEVIERVVSATEAKRLGLIDRIETMDRVLERLNAQPPALGMAAHPTTTPLHAHAEPEAERGGERTMNTTINAAADTVDPDSDGKCPEGYRKGDDGKCHMLPGASSASSAEGATRDGEIVVTLRQLDELKAKAARADRIEGLERQLEAKAQEAADFVDKRREDRIAYKVRDLKIPAFRAFAKVFYDMALRHVPDARMFALADPTKLMTAESVVDEWVAASNKQADVLFRTLSVDTLRRGDPDEPEDLQGRIEHRVTAYLRANKLDKTKDYKTALKAVLDADPDLKAEYAQN